MDFNKPIGEQLGNNLQEKASSMVANVGDTFSSLGESASNAKEGLNSMVSDYSSSSVADVGSAFLDTNSIIAKFVFLIVVLIGFFLLFNLGIYIVSWFATPDRSPYIFKGMYSTAAKKHITQDPKQNGKTIYRSNNEDKGIEFTWSSWLNLELPDSTAGNNTEQHIFNKGTDPESNFKKNAPGVYAIQGKTEITQALKDAVETNYDEDKWAAMSYDEKNALYEDARTENSTLNLKIKMDTINTNPEDITLYDLPIKKWFHLAIRLQNKIIDIYVNGTITTRIPLSEVPNQNYGDIYLGYGGLGGNISNLRYFDRALSVFQISNIVMSGPDLTNPDENVKVGRADYLSNNWYSNSNY